MPWRSRSVPADTQIPEEVFRPPSSGSSHLLEGPVEGLVPEGWGQVLAERPRAMELEAISGRSGAALSALIASLPQVVRDISALEDLSKDPDPEAEVTANVGASISLSYLAVWTTANVGVLTSPPVMDVVGSANVGATTSLAYTTPHTH